MYTIHTKSQRETTKASQGGKNQLDAAEHANGSDEDLEGKEEWVPKRVINVEHMQSNRNSAQCMPIKVDKETETEDEPTIALHGCLGA